MVATNVRAQEARTQTTQSAPALPDSRPSVTTDTEGPASPSPDSYGMQHFGFGEIYGASAPAASKSPNANKTVEELLKDIAESEVAQLAPWRAAIDNFETVLTSASDKEASPDFAGALKKHFEGVVLDKLASKLTGGKLVKGALDALTKELGRASEAKTSAQIRDFVVRLRSKVADLHMYLGMNKVDFVKDTKAAYDKMTPAQQKVFKQALVKKLDQLDANAKTSKDVFRDLAGLWIRESQHPDPRFRRGTDKGAFVLLEVYKENGSLKIRNAKIQAPGGQKIAEQLKKDAGGDVNIWQWDVPHRIVYYKSKDAKWPTGTLHSNPDASMRHVMGQVGDIWSHIRKHGIVKTTPKLSGW